MNRIDAFLELAVNQGGSDLHLVSGQPPRIRISGDLQPIRFRELTVQDVYDFLLEFMDADDRRVLDLNESVDFAYESEKAGRFRVNVYKHVGGIAAAMRVIPTKIPALDTIGLPPVVEQLLSVGKGLTLDYRQMGSAA